MIWKYSLVVILKRSFLDSEIPILKYSIFSKYKKVKW